MKILGYPSIFSQTLSLTRASVSSPGQNPGMHKWQNAYRKVSQRSWKFPERLLWFFYFPTRIKKCRILTRKWIFAQFPTTPPTTPPWSLFLEPHIPTLSPNTGFCSVTASDSSEKVQRWAAELSRLTVNLELFSVLIPGNEYSRLAVSG